MNLIEQLGGYKNSKGIREAYARNGWSVSDVCKGFHEYFTLKDLDCALLEYRRQHNIFEIGDPIIRRWNNCLYWIIMDVDNGSEFIISKNKNAKFKDCKVCDMPCNFTHATPEEIVAGRRL